MPLRITTPPPHATHTISKPSANHVERSNNWRTIDDAAGEAFDKAAGLDGWAPRHWKHLAPKAARWLLVLFTLVETDAPWPAPLQRGKAVFIAKQNTSWEDPWLSVSSSFCRTPTGAGPR